MGSPNIFWNASDGPFLRVMGKFSCASIAVLDEESGEKDVTVPYAPPRRVDWAEDGLGGVCSEGET